jgi:hypothetical protein
MAKTVSEIIFEPILGKPVLLTLRAEIQDCPACGRGVKIPYRFEVLADQIIRGSPVPGQ